MSGPLHVAVLGSLEVRVDVEPVALRPVLRVLVAALALDAPRVVSVDALRSRLWGEETQEGSLTTLHSYVSRLRQQLGPHVVLTQSPGYRLDVQAGDVDAHRFATLLRAARTEPDPHRARLLVAQSTDLWRGEAYADVPQRFARAEAARLGELLLEARELGAELDLALGRHREVVQELTPVLAHDPLRETVRGLLMLALYRGGRQAQALDVYEQGRRALGEELGVDPSPALRRLHEQVLRHDPALDPSADGGIATAGAAQASVAPTARVRSSDDVAHGLVPPPTSMVGRDEHVADVAARVLGGARLVTLTGTGGVGKTRLALAVADHVRTEFMDGVASVSLSTVDEPQLVLPAIDYALGRMLAEGGKSEHTSDARSDLVARLRERRVLLVLDNVEHLLESAADIGWLVGACRGLTVLATSRAPLRVAGSRSGSSSPWRCLPRQAAAAEPRPRGRPRSSRRRPSRSSSSAPAPWPGGSSSTSTRPRPSSRSADAWAASRSPSSWPRRVSGCSPRTRCSNDSTSLLRPAPATCPNDSEPCRARSTGATSCWTDRASSSSASSPSSRAGGRSSCSRTSLDPACSSRWSVWSSTRSSASGGRATGSRGT